MSAHYQSVQTATLYPDAFQVAPPDFVLERHLRPRQQGVFIRRPLHPGGEADATGTDSSPDTASATPSSLRELVAGQFGLVPSWVKSASDARLRSAKLTHARSETGSTATSSRESWLNGQRCIVPMMAFFEDDRRSGKPVPTRIARVDGKPMGVAGLWASWCKEGQTIISFTLLTVNANHHALMQRYQHDGNEKRMPAILGEGAYDAWLDARPEKAQGFMRAYPAPLLTANPVQG